MVTTRAAQDPTGGFSKGAGDAPSQEQDARLVARLRQLVADEGRGRAAEQLGVDRKTVWRMLNSERLIQVMRETLLRLDTEANDSHEGGRDDAGVRELRQQVAPLEDRLQDVEQQLSLVTEGLAELRDSQRTATVQLWTSHCKCTGKAGDLRPTSHLPRDRLAGAASGRRAGLRQ